MSQGPGRRSYDGVWNPTALICLRGTTSINRAGGKRVRLSAGCQEGTGLSTGLEKASAQRLMVVLSVLVLLTRAGASVKQDQDFTDARVSLDRMSWEEPPLIIPDLEKNPLDAKKT